jgi:hypothetical protein
MTGKAKLPKDHCLDYHTLVRSLRCRARRATAGVETVVPWPSLSVALVPVPRPTADRSQGRIPGALRLLRIHYGGEVMRRDNRPALASPESPELAADHH